MDSVCDAISAVREPDRWTRSVALDLTTRALTSPRATTRLSGFRWRLRALDRLSKSDGTRRRSSMRPDGASPLPKLTRSIHDHQEGVARFRACLVAAAGRQGVVGLLRYPVGTRRPASIHRVRNLRDVLRHGFNGRAAMLFWNRIRGVPSVGIRRWRRVNRGQGRDRAAKSDRHGRWPIAAAGFTAQLGRLCHSVGVDRDDRFKGPSTFRQGHMVSSIPTRERLGVRNTHAPERGQVASAHAV